MNNLLVFSCLLLTIIFTFTLPLFLSFSFLLSSYYITGDIYIISFLLPHDNVCTDMYFGFQRFLTPSVEATFMLLMGFVFRNKSSKTLSRDLTFILFISLERVVTLFSSNNEVESVNVN